MNFHLKGKVAVVTGGSRGIGREIAIQLAKLGASVAICARTPEPLEDTARAIRELGVEAWAYPTDVSRHEEIERFVQDVTLSAKRVDILINNAVNSNPATFDKLTDEEFQYHIDVKLMAYIRMARLFQPFIAEHGDGRIVNIGGMTARITAPLRMTNGVTNAGVANFTKQFAVFAAKDKITVNCVHPGYTATERVTRIFRNEAEEAGTDLDTILAKRKAAIPLGRLILPEDIANAVMFFCSPQAAMITGQSIGVDGGSGEAVIY